MTVKNPTKNRTILYRRSKIAGLWAEGMTQQQDIADGLKARFDIDINRSTVSRDLDALKAEWQEERVTDFDQAVTEAIRTRKHLLSLALLDYEKSKEPKETTIQETIDSGPRSTKPGAKPEQPETRAKAQIKTEERNGDPRYLTVASQQAAAIEKIIGVYAPERRDFDLKSGGEPIAITEIVVELAPDEHMED